MVNMNILAPQMGPKKLKWQISRKISRKIAGRILLRYCILWRPHSEQNDMVSIFRNITVCALEAQMGNLNFL
jgi:hypothetical protein